MAIDPRDFADRLVHNIDTEDLSARERVTLATFYLELAHVDALRLRNLIEALKQTAIADDEDRDLLRAVIRRQLGVLPPRAGVRDGRRRNGGD